MVEEATFVTIIPAIQCFEMLHPVSSLEGVGHVIGPLYPATHVLASTRGVSKKALSFASLEASF
ncbi:hypothetical protein CKO25_12790 [Thiocapsa imhoffii]|uniref:Uncharacterized protein n=1 Tax=Thiocapsa imhoffii TaxID=382777 RepID=A0A9X0WJK1_9GAMM|nr:hypothetical protein [Thiocapsa imhoffii]